jgi:hypothetical protein
VADHKVGGLRGYCTRFACHGVRCNNCVRTSSCRRHIPVGKRGTERRDAAAIVSAIRPHTPAAQTHPRIQHKLTPGPYLLPRVVEQVVRVPTTASVGNAFAGAVEPARQE